jgi:hypothetical protein
VVLGIVFLSVVPLLVQYLQSRRAGGVEPGVSN